MSDAFGIGSVKMPRLERPHYLLDKPARRRRVFSMPRELTLDGGEITLLKRIGLSGGQIYGRLLVDDLEVGIAHESLETKIGMEPDQPRQGRQQTLRFADDRVGARRSSAALGLMFVSFIFQV